MLQQALDMREEGDALYDFLKPLEASAWERPTLFNDWTLWDIIAHLHYFDRMALQSLTSETDFKQAADELVTAMLGGVELSALARQKLGKQGPAELLETWHRGYIEMCDRLGEADPQLRLKWFGPDMGVKMFTTARQMETWAHGQAIYDLLRVKRENTDRIKNVAVIGVKTFGWTFINRGLEPPAEAPHVKLTAPSGATWQWNQSNQSDRVEGTAEDFCLVVTQCRNRADTGLRVTGEIADKWMSIAQCFAGGAIDPPAPGERVWE